MHFTLLLSMGACDVSSMRGPHGITVLQVLRKVVLEVGRLLVHAGVGLLMRRLGKLRVKLLPLRGALLRPLPLLLLERC